MRKIVFIFLIIISACNQPSTINKTEIMQACLDKMHQNKDYSYLERSNFILVYNERPSDLGKLYLGNKQLNLTHVNPLEIKVYSSPEEAIAHNNKRFITINRILTKDNTATVVVRLLNVNQIIYFNLIKKDDVWVVDGMSIAVT